MKVKCRTKFDISHTGVTGRFRPNLLPFIDRVGREIKNLEDWNYSRNQQRNFETLVQLVSLRTQPMDLTTPKLVNDHYEFSFSVETTDVFMDNGDELALLNRDCEGVPMLINLGEKDELDPVLRTKGPNTNIWFEKHEE